MGATLGTMFLGLSILASKVHAIPYVEGTPTVISQVGKLVFGGGPFGNVLFYGLQAGTMLILVLAANTSFADFPRLASFHAGDNFMPKQLTKRGHRLVFSNGIIFLAVAAAVLVVATGAKVDKLIPLYAIGVFTSFTLSQAGMAKHHITRKEPGWSKGLFVNATGAVLSLIVDIIIAITKFAHGAWIIIVLVPIMVYGLVRLNRQYETEAHELERDAEAACTQPILRRHVVLVFVVAPRPDDRPGHPVRPGAHARRDAGRPHRRRPPRRRAARRRVAPPRPVAACPSSSSTAPTAGSRAPRSRWSRPRRVTARPRSAS